MKNTPTPNTQGFQKPNVLGQVVRGFQVTTHILLAPMAFLLPMLGWVFLVLTASEDIFAYFFVLTFPVVYAFSAYKSSRARRDKTPQGTKRLFYWGIALPWVWGLMGFFLVRM